MGRLVNIHQGLIGNRSRLMSGNMGRIMYKQCCSYVSIYTQVYVCVFKETRGQHGKLSSATLYHTFETEFLTVSGTYLFS